MARYDEDLHENTFFQILVGKHKSLFNDAAEQRLLVCVPRCDTVFRLRLDRKDFENHILRPFKPEEVENNFISLNNKFAVISGDMIKVGQGYKEPRSVKILFDECFFNSREESYQVFCLEQPLEGAMGEDIMISLKNLDECSKFLWGEPGGDKVRRLVDRLIEFFHVEKGNLRPIIDAALAIYTRAVQEVFKFRKFQAAMHKNFCKLAVETYLMAGLHKKMFKEVCFTVAAKDAALNKITRNLSDSSQQSLGIKSQFRLLIPKAQAILAQLNQFSTPLEKLYCFSHTIDSLTSAAIDVTVTADELLPILVYLVIITDIPNWTGNLVYINRFHFSEVTFEEFTYYLTSFEAAVEYVRSEHVLLMAHTPSAIKPPTTVTTVQQRIRCNSSGVAEEARHFLNLVSQGDVTAVREMLDKALVEKSSLKSQLCHPLCGCKRCTDLQERQLDDSDRVSVFLRDPDGRTGLHYAALLGHNELVRLLMEYGAIVTATDHNSSTPLHLSCLKGHQKCTLLLLGEGSSINAVDNHGNTPLHQACSNGHEECVKSLLFHTTKCEVNIANEQGDTPLHNAARWGYASIVSELLSMGTSSQLQNRRREVPYQCAQNRKVQELLSDVRYNDVQKTAGDDGGGLEGPGADMVDGESPVVVRPRRMSKRISMRDSMRVSMSEMDRQLKKLFRAIQDEDSNLVRFIFGWEEPSRVSPEDLCHPLCLCDRCSKLKKRSATSVLSVNCTDMVGHTPLHKACLLGHRELVDMFLRHGSLLDSKTKDNDQTPLHLACQYNQKDVVLLLLEHNVQIDPQDSLGNTPLHLACSNGHMETTALLLMHGADVAICNNRMDTPLHNAARWNHPALVNELLLYGASYTATNNDNKTPRDLSSDDQVENLIWKASNGVIAVGSYSPLRRPVEPPPHVGKVSSLGSGVKQSAPNATISPLSSELESSSSKSRDLIEEEEGETYVVIDRPEEEHHRIVQQQAPGQRSTNQVLSNRGQRHSEERVSGIGEIKHGTEEGLEQRPHPRGEGLEQRPHPRGEGFEQRPHHRGEGLEQRLHPRGEERLHPKSDEYRGEELDQRPHDEEEEFEQIPHPIMPVHVGGKEEKIVQRPHPKGEDVNQRSGPKKDEKLISLLEAIEAFDRSTLNRKSRMGSVSSPISPLPPPITPPHSSIHSSIHSSPGLYSPLHSYFLPPGDDHEEMQTAGAFAPPL